MISYTEYNADTYFNPNNRVALNLKYKLDITLGIIKGVNSTCAINAWNSYFCFNLYL